MKAAFASSIIALAFAATLGAQQQPLAYRLDEARRNVTVSSGESTAPVPVKRGSIAHSGDQVHTGWFSYALIASDAYRAKFEVFSLSDVQLSGGTPGVVLSLERGRIRAAFDKLTGTEPRIVQTPGALLAVRGTQFDVEVDKTGHTTVDVFEGLVEVQSPLRPEPLFIHPGEQGVFDRRSAPTSRPMPEDRRRNAPAPRDGHEGDARNPRGNNQPPAPRGGMDGGSQPRGGQQPGGMQPPPPPPPNTGGPHGGGHEPAA